MIVRLLQGPKMPVPFVTKYHTCYNIPARYFLFPFPCLNERNLCTIRSRGGSTPLLYVRLIATHSESSSRAPVPIVPPFPHSPWLLSRMYLYSLGLPEDAPQFDLLFNRGLSPHRTPVCRSSSTTVLDFASSAYVHPDPSTLDRVCPSYVP